MQKREPFLRELPEEFLLERGGWSFHKGKVWLRELMLSVVPWYMERITCPLDVGWHFMGGNGAIPVEAGGGGGREKGSISVTVLLAFCTGKRQLAQKCSFSLHSPSGKAAGWQTVCPAVWADVHQPVSPQWF